MLEQAQEVCPTTTQRLLKQGYTLVDVREHDESARLAFDVPQLIIMPLSEFEQRYAELPTDPGLPGWFTQPASHLLPDEQGLYQCHQHEVRHGALGGQRLPYPGRSRCLGDHA